MFTREATLSIPKGTELSRVCVVYDYTYLILCYLNFKEEYVLHHLDAKSKIIKEYPIHDSFSDLFRLNEE